MTRAECLSEVRWHISQAIAAMSPYPRGAERSAILATLGNVLDAVEEALALESEVAG